MAALLPSSCCQNRESSADEPSVLWFYQSTELLTVVETTHSSILLRTVQVYKINLDETWKKCNESNSYPAQIKNTQFFSAEIGCFTTADTVNQLY